MPIGILEEKFVLIWISYIRHHYLCYLRVSCIVVVKNVEFFYPFYKNNISFAIKIKAKLFLEGCFFADIIF